MSHNQIIIQARNNINNPQAKIIDLEHQKLSLKDFEKLGDIIKKAVYVEQIVLPKLPPKLFVPIIDILHDGTAYNTTLKHLRIITTSFKNILPEHTALQLQQIYTRLKRNASRIFAIHGGGNIGLGLLANIVSKSSYNYHVVATSSDTFKNELINANHCFHLKHDNNTSCCINHVTMVNASDDQNIENLYNQASLLAICLTENAFVDVSPLIARALLKRYLQDQSQLKILIVMNKAKAEQFVKDVLLQQLNLITDCNQAESILNKLLLLPTVADRIVAKIRKEEIITQLKENLQANPALQNRFPSTKKISIEQLLQNDSLLRESLQSLKPPLYLFTAEEYYQLYTTPQFTEAALLPGIIRTPRLDLLAEVKNKFLNGPHAILAWLGSFIGYQKVCHAMQQKPLLNYLCQLMDQEIAPILRSAYPELASYDFAKTRTQFFQRCLKNTADLVTRVGRDPLRKLKNSGCLRGTLMLKEKHQLNIATPLLEFGIAAGFFYGIQAADQNNKDCLLLRKMFLKNKSYKPVLLYQGPSSSGFYEGLNSQEDKECLRHVLENLVNLEKLNKLTSQDRRYCLNKFIVELYQKAFTTEPFVKFKLKSKTKTTQKIPLQYHWIEKPIHHLHNLIIVKPKQCKIKIGLF